MKTIFQIEKENDSGTVSSSWKQLTNRRLKTWGGFPSHNGMQQMPLPAWISRIGKHLVDIKALPAEPNHVLLNEYTNGKGIGVSN